MRIRPMAILTAITFITGLATQSYAYDLGDEGLEVAELIIHLAKGIAGDLSRPATGAERVVTNANVTDEGYTRTYYIEGEDVYHTGRVLNTFWVRLSKRIYDNNGKDSNFTAIEVGHGLAPKWDGHALSMESQELIGSLLNGVYDFAEMNLDHQKVVLGQIAKISEDPISFEIIGENRICEHTELNSFKIILTRHFDHNRPSYVTELILPYADGAETTEPEPAPAPSI